MSVQVRRRREAASFLSSFVGAQGELIVDTTNNRLQVHDGVRPGGWPVAGVGDLSGRNAVINGNFAINQRAYASTASLAAGAYAHDRWKAAAGGAAYSFSQTVPDTTITITSGTLIQAVDAPNVYAAAWWLTWTGTAPARVWQGSPAGAFSAGLVVAIGGTTVNALLVSGLAVGSIANLEFGIGTLGLVQFEAALPNAGPTRFERRHGEMALCQRYYQVQYLTARFPASAVNQIMETPFFLSPSMRAAPTATYLGGGQRSNTSVSIISSAVSGGRFFIVSVAPGDAYAVADPWSFSAEL